MNAGNFATSPPIEKIYKSKIVCRLKICAAIAFVYQL